eukprot:307907-Pelagomonas_calceolata.AAC.7
MAACNKLLGCVATSHARAGEAQADPQTPLLCQTPPRCPLPFRSPSLPQRPGLLSGLSSTPALSLGPL